MSLIFNQLSALSRPNILEISRDKYIIDDRRNYLIRGYVGNEPDYRGKRRQTCSPVEAEIKIRIEKL